MKYICLFVLIFSPVISTAAVNDEVTTGKEVIGEVRAQAGGVFYFVSEDGNWNAPNCPNAKYAYFRDSLTIGNEIFSAALASKLSKTPIKFRGICGDEAGNDNYIRINYMIF